MSMLDLTKQELEKYNALTPGLNPFIQQIVNAVPFTTVPYRMKSVIAVAQLTNFAAQFKRNIELWDDTKVPINSISFIIAGSGGGKDSSVKAARKCFNPGFELIEEARKKIVIKEAIKAATSAGEEVPTEYDVYKEYMKSIPPIDIMPTTGPGLIQHINDIGDLELSSGFIYSGEFSDELAYNQDMTENIKILSEVYDTGDKEAKYTKGAEFRSQTIEGQPVSALFVGSPGHILYDEATKKKFNIAFTSKLARRSWFCYTPEVMSEPVFEDIEEMLEYEEQIEIEAKQARAAMQESVEDITRFGLDTANTSIKTTEEVFKLFKVYKRYNNEYVNTLPNQESTYALIRKHLQWKALKLAGAFALFDKSNIIEAKHYVDAIKFCELLDKDMEIFEHDLNKSYHERFSDYIRTQVGPDNKAIINIHDIKKLGFMSSVAKNKLQELITLCAGYDNEGIYSIVNKGGAIQYEPVIKTEVLGISYKPIDCTELDNAVKLSNDSAVRTAKHNIAINTVYGFDVAETTFEDLSRMLHGSYAYSPFKFRDGVRKKDNIQGGTKWLVLDVDSSPISAQEAHFMLSDINHHIALSSDPDNDYKYRVIIELDSIVELDGIAWKYFYLAIAEDLALKVDPLPQSQIFYSYAGRKVYSNLDAEPLVTRDYVMQAKEKKDEKTTSKPRSAAQQKALLQDPLNTFNFAYEAEKGSRSRSLIRAVYWARDLGASKDQIIELVTDINEYWQIPLEESRFDNILNQIERMSL